MNADRKMEYGTMIDNLTSNTTMKLESNDTPRTSEEHSPLISSQIMNERYILAGEINKSNSNRDNYSSPYKLKNDSESPYHILKNVSPVFHSKLGRLLNDERFDQFILLLIILNSILTAVVTFRFIREDPQKRALCEHFDEGLLIIFTIELLFNLSYYGPIDFLKDGWLMFDLIIVTMSWVFDVSAFRVFRAFRIIRAFRLIRKMEDMRLLVTALLNVLPRMFAILMLLSVIFFVFAVLFTELFFDSYENGITSEDYFGRLDKTAFTLVQFMLIDGWAQITKELMEVYPWAWVPSLLFVAITTFVVINLIIAVICDAVASLQTAEMAEHVEDIKNQTTDAIQVTEEDHKERMTRLERKLDSLVYMLSKYENENKIHNNQ